MLWNIYIADVVASILMVLADDAVIPGEFIFECLLAGVSDFHLDKLVLSLSSFPG